MTELEEANNTIEDLEDDLAYAIENRDNMRHHLESALMINLAVGGQAYEQSEQFLKAAREMCGASSPPQYIAQLKTQTRQQGYHGNS